MSTNYRLRAAYLYFARPTPILPDQWSRQVLSSLYPQLNLDAVRIVGRMVGALPTPAQVDSNMAAEGYDEAVFRWNRRDVTDSTGQPITLVEVYEAPLPVAVPLDASDMRTPPFTRRDLMAGALAGVGGGLAMGLLAMLVGLFDRSGAMSVWAPLNQIASAILGPDVVGPQFNFTTALVGSLFHFGLSALLGMAFALIYHGVLRLPRRLGAPVAAGAIYGLVIFFLADLLLPMLAPGMAFAAKPGFIAGHMVFGLVIGIVYSRLRPNFSGLLVVLASLLFLGAGVVVTSLNLFMPVQASEQAVGVDSLFNLMMGIATVIFLLVQAALVYAALQFRRKPGDDEDGPPIHGNNTLEIIWTTVPAIIVIIISFLSYQTFVAERAFAKTDMVVEVTGQQFFWTFYYPEEDITVQNELVVPIGRPVQYRLRATDVLHAFWVPDFRIKRDAMPDRVTDTRATASKIGEYAIVCAELCGAGHAQMRGTIKVVSAADFEAWVQEQQSKTVDANDPIAYGRSVFQKAGCTTCHTLTDAGGAGQIGPDLNQIGVVAATRVAGQTAAEYIRTSIVKPGEYLAPQCPMGACPANVMLPTFGTSLSEAELTALVTYLSSQK
ncbi:MAG: cytochrome c oxidase subunit II [Anaerolineae bacterium]